jgi:hypothetical protein
LLGANRDPKLLAKTVSRLKSEIVSTTGFERSAVSALIENVRSVGYRLRISPLAIRIKN